LVKVSKQPLWRSCRYPHDSKFLEFPYDLRFFVIAAPLQLQGFLCIKCNICKYLAFAMADHPHNSNPRPASAAALLKQQLAATSAAGALTF